MLRILHVVHGMDCGGTENMIMNLYRKTDRSIIQYDFLVHTNKACFFDEEIIGLGGRIYHVPYFNGLNYFQYKKALREFYSSHHDFQIVHGHLGSCAAIYLKEAKRAGLYTVAHSHSNYASFNSPRAFIYHCFARRVTSVADYFLGCSLDAGLARFGKKIVSGNRFSVLRNAIDPSSFCVDSNAVSRLKHELGLDGKFVVGHVGRFSKEKNHSFLLDVFSEIARINKDSVLLLVGDGSTRQEIEEKARDFNLIDRVVFTGVRSDVPLLMHTMDCFVFPSVFEGLGIVAVEAQCIGLPCFINDALPTDIRINENVHPLSLQLTSKDWASSIVKHSRFISKDIANQNILHAGYDINVTVRELEAFYTKRSPL